MAALVRARGTESIQPGDESLARLLIEALPCAALVIDPEGRIAALNLKAETLLGWNASALEGRPVHKLLDCRLDASDSSTKDCPLTALVNGDSASAGGQMWVRHRDERSKLVEYQCAPFPTPRGLGVILTCSDLTRRLALEKDSRRLAAIAEESPIAIVELNESANMTYANPVMMSLIERFGFTTEARPAALPVNIEKLVDESLRSETAAGEIGVSVGKSYFAWKLVPVAGEKLVRGYGIDLTVRRRVEIELAQAKAEAEVASRAKSRFLANVSHEIRTPIFSIQGMAELLTLSELDGERIKCAKIIQSSAGSLMAAMEKILDIVALDNGMVKVETTLFDFRALMNEITGPFLKAAEEKDLQFTLTIADRVPARIRCDGKRLGQVLHHLIGNALKFTQRGEVSVEVDRDVISNRFTRKEGEKQVRHGKAFYLFFSVRDTGIGVPPDKRKVIFERFSQADCSTTRCYDGTGLGLAIAKELAELMGGAIGVESEPGKGSNFWLRLPVAAANE